MTDIVNALKKAGALVELLYTSGPGSPNLLVDYRRRTFLLEVNGIRPLNGAPWQRLWNGLPVVVVHTPEEALRAIGVQFSKE